jgi:putative hydrolase of the HAD superfamily
VLEDRFGVVVSEARARHALMEEITYYRAHMQEGDTPTALADLRRRCAHVLRAALPASSRLEAISEADLTEALLAALRFEAYDDAAAALRRARERGQRVAVVSNWDCSLSEVLERVGLAGWLDAVLTSAQVGAAKPSPIMFERALAQFGVAPEEALHVGDSVAEDVQGARAAAIRVLLLAREGRPAPPGVATIASLADL